MSPIAILDLVAGLIFIYFLLAIVNNSLFEIFLSFSKFRAIMLRKWLVQTFESGTLDGFAIMNHPLVSGLSAKNKAPSYMGGKAFATVISDLLLKAARTKGDAANAVAQGLAAVEAEIKASGLPANIENMLLTFCERSKLEKTLTPALNELEHFERQVEAWFDSSMERLGGRFKRKSFGFTFVFSLVTVCALNVDSISLANYFYSHDAARTAFAEKAYADLDKETTKKYVAQIKAEKKSSDSLEQAEKKVDASVPSTSASGVSESGAKGIEGFENGAANIDSIGADIKSEQEKIKHIVSGLQSELPLGWGDGPVVKQLNVKKIGGLLISIFAVCLGAPFWFEMLGKIANLRSTIKPGDKSKKEVNP